MRLPFWGAAALSLVNAGYGFFVLPESLSRARRTRFAWRASNPFGSLMFLRANPLVLRLATAGFLQRFAHGSLPSMFVLYADYRYGWDLKMIGLTLFGVGVSQMIVSGGLVGPVVARLGERGALVVGLLFGITGFTIYGLAPTGLWFLVALPLVALWALANPAIQSLTTRYVSPLEQGRLQGAQSSLGGVADMLGPLIFTHIFSAAIAAHGAAHQPGAPYLLAALLVIGALIVSWRVARPVAVAAE